MGRSIHGAICQLVQAKVTVVMQAIRRHYRLLLLAVFLLGSLTISSLTLRQVWAQTPSDTQAGPSADPVPTGSEATEEAVPAAAPARDDSINVLQLALDGGIFMIPIAAMSLLGVTMAIERFIGLRKERILPDGLVTDLGQLSLQGGFDPRKAYRICQQYPSSAANIVRSMLLKVGRPLSEVEHTVSEASAREADRLYGNVRWLNLAASVTPLLGLLGTVQGMILAFHMTTVIDAGQNKSIALAEGIYTALVTTFAGLTVAIPAAMLSHYFEGRIQTLFHQVDELIFNLLPQIEKYEGRVRFGRAGGEPDMTLDEPRPAPAAQQAPAVAASSSK